MWLKSKPEVLWEPMGKGFAVARETERLKKRNIISV